MNYFSKNPSFFLKMSFLYINRKLDNEDLKKVERAKRFGMVIPEVEEEKKKLRAQKFGSEIDAGTFLKDKKIKLG